MPANIHLRFRYAAELLAYGHVSVPPLLLPPKIIDHLFVKRIQTTIQVPSNVLHRVHSGCLVPFSRLIFNDLTAVSTPHWRSCTPVVDIPLLGSARKYRKNTFIERESPSPSKFSSDPLRHVSIASSAVGARQVAGTCGFDRIGMHRILQPPLFSALDHQISLS